MSWLFVVVLMYSSYKGVIMDDWIATKFQGWYVRKDGLIAESILFIPAVTINCSPPYQKGVVDSCWVKYKQGERPTTKAGWENLIGMELIKVL